MSKTSKTPQLITVRITRAEFLKLPMHQLEQVVAELSDGYKWNWCDMTNNRNAADSVLRLLARHGLIEQACHPLTIGPPGIFRVNGKLFGRTDGITHDKFDQLKNQDS